MFFCFGSKKQIKQMYEGFVASKHSCSVSIWPIGQARIQFTGSYPQYVCTDYSIGTVVLVQGSTYTVNLWMLSKNIYCDNFQCPYADMLDTLPFPP